MQNLESAAVDWTAVRDGAIVREETITEFEMQDDAIDMAPPGCEGPPLSSRKLANEGLSRAPIMFGTGTSGIMGAAWKMPQLAFSLFSTYPAEMLDLSSLAGLASALTPGSLAHRVLDTAARMQALHCQTSATAVQHNQVRPHHACRALALPHPRSTDA